ALIVAIAVVASCSTSDSRGPDRAATPVTPAAAPAAARAANVSAPFDLGGVMKQVHFAYRPEGSGFVGGHRSYEVRASAGGFEVTPASPGAPAAAPARFVTAAIGRGTP